MANVDQIKVHPLKFNMEPENDGFQVRNLRFKGLIFRWIRDDVRHQSDMI